jgi:hypothetical protein
MSRYECDVLLSDPAGAMPSRTSSSIGNDRVGRPPSWPCLRSLTQAETLCLIDADGSMEIRVDAPCVHENNFSWG